MDPFGLNAGYLLTQLFGLCLFAGWLALAVWTLTQLRRVPLDPTTKALWVLIIVLVPFLGAIAYWIVRPGR